VGVTRRTVRETATEPHLSTHWLNAAAFAGMFGFGIVMALLGAVLPLLAQRLHFDLARAGDLFFVMNAGMLVTTLVVGPFTDRFGHKFPLIIAPLFVTIALGLIPRANSFEELLVGVLLLGIGGGALNQVTNTLIADLYAEVHAKNAALNVLGVFFGFGALFVPFAIGSALRTLGFGRILFLAMGLSLIPAVVSIPLAFPVPRQREGVSGRPMLSLLGQPIVLTFALLLFFQSGNEFVLGGYITTYLTRELGVTVSTASYLLAAYWASLMLSRVILSRVMLRQRGELLVRSGALGVAVSMALLLVIGSAPAALVCVSLLGFSIATIFPTVLGLAGSCYPSHAGTVFSILIGIALVGGMTMPWLAGRIAENFGIRRALFLVIVNALAIIGFEWGAERMLKKQGNAA
jgi:MFS transporter, FHS family, glucose/mannose:H+ symporter